MTPTADARVGIGMPVYNGEDYMEQTLRSILAQTFGDFELVISDNASTDRTEEICQTYAAADPRVRYLRQDENRGGAWNFNTVFHASRGEYFKWACHDDLMAETYLERCVAVMDDHPDVAICYPKTLLIDAEGNEIGPYEDELHLMDASPVERFRRVVFRKPRRCHPSLGLMRRDLLAQTDLIGAYRSSDEILLAHLALLGKYYEYPERLAVRRIHEGCSIVANPTIGMIYSWYNPWSRRRFLFPTLRHFFGYLGCVWRSDLSRADRLRCTRLAARRLRWDRNKLAREVRYSFGTSPR